MSTLVGALWARCYRMMLCDGSVLGALGNVGGSGGMVCSGWVEVAVMLPILYGRALGRWVGRNVGGMGGFWGQGDRAWAPLHWLQTWGSLHELAVHHESLRLLQAMLLPRKAGRPRRLVLLLWAG